MSGTREGQGVNEEERAPEESRLRPEIPRCQGHYCQVKHAMHVEMHCASALTSGRARSASQAKNAKNDGIRALSWVVRVRTQRTRASFD